MEKFPTTLPPDFESIHLRSFGLGPRLRALRKRAQFTQEGLAHAAGLHRGTVADLERGRRWNLQWSTALRLSAAMGLQAELLLATDEPARPILVPASNTPPQLDV